MSDFNLLVSSIDPNDKEKLIAKAFVASKILRILAVIAIIITLVIAVPIILAGGLISGGVLTLENVEGGTATAVTGGAMAVFFGMFILFIGMIGQIFTLWYTGKLKKQLENNEVPNLIFPYTFLVFTAFSLYGSVQPEVSIFGIILYSVVAYLWFVVINTVSKIKNLV